MSAAIPLRELLPNFTGHHDSSTAQMLAERTAAHEQHISDAAQAQRRAVEDQLRQSGYDAGYAAARGGTVDATRALSARLDALQDTVAASVRTQSAQDADSVIASAMVLAQWVIARELTLDPATFVPAVTEVIADLAPAMRVSLAVHPDVHDLYRELGESLERDVTVNPDPGVAPGEAVVTTGDGGVARVGAADALRRALAAISTTAALQDTP